MKRIRRDLTGDRCGQWTVEGPMQRTTSGRKWWSICDCGETAWVLETTLKKTKSGCRKCLAEEASKRQTTHGLSSDPKFVRYRSMVSRCHNPEAETYVHYGARGIRVCDRWLNGEGDKSGYECWLEDMDPPAGKGWHLHRSDNDKNYEPGNCVWLTVTEHMKFHGKAAKAQAIARRPARSIREAGRRLDHTDMTATWQRLGLGGHSKGGERG